MLTILNVVPMIIDFVGESERAIVGVGGGGFPQANPISTQVARFPHWPQLRFGQDRPSWNVYIISSGASRWLISPSDRLLSSKP